MKICLNEWHLIIGGIVVIIGGAFLLEKVIGGSAIIGAQNPQKILGALQQY